MCFFIGDVVVFADWNNRSSPQEKVLTRFITRSTKGCPAVLRSETGSSPDESPEEVPMKDSAWKSSYPQPTRLFLRLHFSFARSRRDGGAPEAPDSVRLCAHVWLELSHRSVVIQIFVPGGTKICMERFRDSKREKAFGEFSTPIPWRPWREFQLSPMACVRRAGIQRGCRA